MAWDYAIALQPKDKDGGADPDAIPISRVLGVSIQYGKNALATSYSAGRMLIELDNSDGALTPGGGGTWANARFVGVECDFYTTVTGESPDLGDYTPRFFSGNVTDVDIKLANKFDSRVILTCTDALGQLGTYFEFCYFYDANTEGGPVAFGDPDAAADGLMPFVLSLADADQFTSDHYLINNGSPDLNVWAFPEFANIGDYLRKAIEAENGDFFVRHGLPIVRTSTGKRNLLTYRARSGPTVTDDPTLSVSHLEPLIAYDTSVSSPPAGARDFANADFEVGTSYGYTAASFTMRTHYDYINRTDLASGTSIGYASLGRQSAVAWPAPDSTKLYLNVTANTVDAAVKIFVETADAFGDWETFGTFVKLSAGDTGTQTITVDVPSQALLAVNATADSAASSGAITFQVTAYEGDVGAEQTAGQTSTQNTYGVQDQHRTDMHTVSDAATLACAESFLQRYGPEDGDPMVLRSLRFPPVFPGDNDGWEMAKFSTGDAISVAIDAAGSTMTFDGMVVGVRWDITPRGGATLTTFSENADLFSPFILDDDLFGVLDENLLG
ncbi:MAG: hypothetical protein ACO3N1_08335 [Ilumatobacteraceae bacterium]